MNKQNIYITDRKQSEQIVTLIKSLTQLMHLVTNYLFELEFTIITVVVYSYICIIFIIVLSTLLELTSTNCE